MKKLILRMCIAIGIMLSVTQHIEAADDEFNIVEIGKEYSINSLTGKWGTYRGYRYTLQTEIPEDGRIRVWINDFTYDIYHEDLMMPSEGSVEWDDIESWETRDWIKSLESMNSGWITVNKGKYYLKLDAEGKSNSEANIHIEFESTADYFGEKEDNDTLDEATEMILGERYEGNYSKEDDEDYYKFVLDSPGLIEISSEDVREDELMSYRIFEEDDNLNVNEIYRNYDVLESEYDVADRLRLPAGIYYFYVDHDRFSPEYIIKVKYTDESSEKFEQEYNNISKRANEILPREKYTGNLNTIDDIDYYKFYVPRKSYVRVCSWIPRQIGDKLLTITLYDENLNKITSVTTNENAYKESKAALVEKGYYYIRVRDCDEWVYDDSPDALDNLFDYSICANVKCYKHVFEKKILKRATTKRDGLRDCTCKVCGHEEEQTIRRIGEIKLSSTSYTYDGKIKSPSVYIRDSKGNTIDSNNYIINKPIGRQNVGQYIYKVTFKNEYLGTKSLIFKINPKGTSVLELTKAKKAFTVKWKKQSEKMKLSRITGYQIQYSTSKKFISPKTVTVSGYSTTSKKITKLSAEKIYYVRIRTYKNVNGTRYYSAWSGYKSVKTK